MIVLCGDNSNYMIHVGHWAVLEALQQCLAALHSQFWLWRAVRQWYGVLKQLNSLLNYVIVIIISIK